MMELIPIGKIVSTHGLRGEVKFRYYNEVQEDFSSYTSFFTIAQGGPQEIKPDRIKWAKGFFYIIFENIHTIEDAIPLVNKELFVDVGALPCLEKGSYYDFQLQGLTVFNHKKEPVGIVKEILHQSGSDILIVEHGNEEIFIPMIDEYIDRIDTENSLLVLTDVFLTI